MKLKLDTVLLNRDGSEFKQRTKIKYLEPTEEGEIIEKERSEDQLVTLGRMLKAALLIKGDSMDEESIMEKYNLFRKIEEVDEVEVDEKELKLLKKLICSP